MDTTMIGYSLTKTCEHIFIEDTDEGKGQDSVGPYEYIISTTKCVRCGCVESVHVHILDS